MIATQDGEYQLSTEVNLFKNHLNYWFNLTHPSIYGNTKNPCFTKIEKKFLLRSLQLMITDNSAHDLYPIIDQNINKKPFWETTSTADQSRNHMSTSNLRLKVARS